MFNTSPSKDSFLRGAGGGKKVVESFEKTFCIFAVRKIDVMSVMI